MTVLALWAIRFYQRFISARKGFSCAYAAYTGCASCSALGYRAIQRFGVWRGLAVLNGRLEKCGVAYRRYQPQANMRALAQQGGFLDCGGCDGCDVPSSCNKGPGSCFLDAANCGKDLGDCSWGKKRWKKEKFIPNGPLCQTVVRQLHKSN